MISLWNTSERIPTRGSGRKQADLGKSCIGTVFSLLQNSQASSPEGRYVSHGRLHPVSRRSRGRGLCTHSNNTWKGVAGQKGTSTRGGRISAQLVPTAYGWSVRNNSLSEGSRDLASRSQGNIEGTLESALEWGKKWAN